MFRLPGPAGHWIDQDAAGIIWYHDPVKGQTVQLGTSYLFELSNINNAGQLLMEEFGGGYALFTPPKVILAYCPWPRP
jgi:hypothetical protein